MGHKVHPIGVRLGIVKDWSARWYANKRDFANTLHEDIKARALVEKELAQARVSRVRIERRTRNAVRMVVDVAQPGAAMGRKGEVVERLSEKVSRIFGGVPVNIAIEEVRKPELDAKLVAESIAQQLERRVMFRRAMKRAVSTAMRLGAKGIKINISGRLGGAEIARSEWSREGRVPLHTFRADIDYGVAEAKTTYGIIGVKVWIFKGEVIGKFHPGLEQDAKSAKSDDKSDDKAEERKHKSDAKAKRSAETKK